MLNIGLHGASGRMGREILKVMDINESFYSLAFTKSNRPCDLRYEVLNFSEINRKVDVVIDFSSPEGVMTSLDWCLLNKVALVVGTTGLSVDELNRLEESSKLIPILVSPNMSLSVNALFSMSKKMASVLPNAEVEIFEAHHRYKKDSPSGTALKVGECVASGRGDDFDSVAVFNRARVSDSIRKPNEIGFSIMRAGDVIGKHTVSFFMNGEELSITSEITDRRSFAEGALLAADYLHRQNNGFYSMQDVLNLIDV